MKHGLPSAILFQSMRYWHPAQNQLRHKTSKWNKMALPVINSVHVLKRQTCLIVGNSYHSTDEGKVGLFHYSPTCHRNISSKTAWKAPTESYWTTSKILSCPLSLIWCSMKPKYHTTHAEPPDSGLDSAPSKPMGFQDFTEKLKTYTLVWLFLWARRILWTSPEQ